MAGFLTDVKLGRYKVLQYSTWFIQSLYVFCNLIANLFSKLLGGHLNLAFGILYLLLGYCGYNAVNMDWTNFVRLHLKTRLYFYTGFFGPTTAVYS